MVVIIAFFSGIRHDHMLLALFMLSFCTICFGWVTEALSRPDPASRGSGGTFYPANGESARRAVARHTHWEIGAPNNRDLLVFGCFSWWGPIQRMGPHLLGWVPYAALWYIVLDTFSYSVSRAERKPPDFVNVIVWGQMIVFSSFAVVQIFQQSSHYGCRKYWVGECCYIILSVLSKGLLGGVLLANILLASSASFDEALADADMSA